MFKLNLYIPIIFVTLIMGVFAVFSIVYIQESSIHKSKERISERFTKNLDEKVAVEAAALNEYIDFIQERDDIANLFLLQDKKQLNNSLIDIYSRLNKNIELTHMYFIRNDGSVLLRVHDYERDKDIVDRVTFKKSKEKQSLFYGLEFGLKKNYTLRVVKPWFLDGKIIGYIELGKEIDKIINELAHLLNTHIYLAVKKEVYNDAPQFVKDSLANKAKTSGYYIVYNTYAVPDEIESILDGSIANDDIRFGDVDYFVSKQHLSDVSGKELGHFLFLTDVSLEHGVMYGAIKIFSGIITFISIILITGAYILIKRRESSINTLTAKLEKKQAALELFNVKLQKIFDLQRNIVMITDGKKVIMANQAMFDFFGFDDLDDFLKHHKSICDRFVVNDNFFHLGKISADELWVDVVKKLPGEKRIVAMLDHDLMSHAFSVSVNEFGDGNYVISFTDISNTMIEHSKLKRKVTHDKLTGAYNREFFETNIDLIIKEFYPKQLGIVLCDIDYFKRVNDTYGHNRGDIVLKEFTNIINNSVRDSDYLIRWGGEEFICLIKVNSIDSLERVTQKIRKHVESCYFDEVGTITSSFGITLYIEDESMSKAIERADKALYAAKANGRNQVQIL